LCGQGVLFAYLFLAVRTFYHDKIVVAAVKALALIFAMDYMLLVYRFILFLTALYSS
jgi:hypothetical protein